MKPGAGGPQPVTRVVRRTRANEVADQIEKQIASGEFAVGSDLPAHKDLMARFCVGRPAVREALFFLQQKGLVQIENGRRARVSPGTNDIIIQQLASISKRLTTTARGQEHVEQMRLLLESGLAWHCARVATDADVARLKAALDANVAAVGDVVAFIRTDVAFHYELAAITGNPILLAIHEVVVEWLIDQRTTTSHMPDADKLSVRDHTAIYAAVAARDPARAFHEMASHIQLVGKLYREAKRVSDEILRGVTHDVARRFEAEKAAMWGGPAAEDQRQRPVRAAKRSRGPT